MNKFSNRSQSVILFGLTLSLATFMQAHAAQPKLDLDAEAKQSAKEDADQADERKSGPKYQHVFFGTFNLVADDSQKLSPDVVGTFDTSAPDIKPGRKYLVKAENGNKTVLEKLKLLNGKKVQVSGKLRVIGADGEAKYLVVSSVLESSSTPKVAERRKQGGA